jgi:hypothetical protein
MSLMPYRHLVPLAPLLLAAAGCADFFGPKLCTAEARPGLLIAVVDSVTGASVLPGATIIVQNAVFNESATIPDGPQPSEVYSTAYEAAGTYTVTVRKTGYQDWVRAGVTVTRDECHVRTVELLAKLQR